MEDAEPTATGAGGTDMSDIIKALEYGFNPSKIVDTLYFRNGENYRLHKAIANTQIPVWSWWSGAKVASMEDKEQLRYISDLAKNTGINPSNWKYPIRMGYYGYSGSYGSIMASTNAGIMNLYKKATYKPKDVNIYNNRYIHNHGAYYRYGDFNNNNYYR